MCKVFDDLISQCTTKFLTYEDIFHFHTVFGKFWPNNMLASLHFVLVAPSPLESPGVATDCEFLTKYTPKNARALWNLYGSPVSVFIIVHF